MDLLHDERIEQGLRGLRWERDGNALVKRAEFADFAEAMHWVNRVAGAAEDAGHHPDIHVSWNKVTLRLWTHVAGGITEADLALAARIDALGDSPP